ncbi:hypothetical protein ITP53_17315 [Nonomuraea sp. K274]|uniref:Uncharacterized protein n=1 Tax=Nonomuraea cypriaca TaxID=1187855 RepID=A0A931EZE7_9ACTN|nr:hypothetical protein [Nonomuraea cypriaca]MBF8187462.1 hypothetical protein [Nonomuraea cypriaca]
MSEAPRLEIDVRISLTVEQATAALAGLPGLFSSAAGQRVAELVTPGVIRAELTALVLTHGMRAIDREAVQLADWEHTSDSDAALVGWCRDMVARCLAAQRDRAQGVAMADGICPVPHDGKGGGKGDGNPGVRPVRKAGTPPVQTDRPRRPVRGLRAVPTAQTSSAPTAGPSAAPSGGPSA